MLYTQVMWYACILHGTIESSHLVLLHKNTKILVINFQSVKNKKEELCNPIDSSNPSMIIGTETWLQKDISSSEIFPDSYTVTTDDLCFLVMSSTAHLIFSMYSLLLLGGL
jgi:hypothetical protein